MEQTTHPLSGVRFLVIEDEIMQALSIDDMLADMGGVVAAHAFAYDEARQAVKQGGFDCAVLDVNLNGTLSFPIAEMLRERGVPFIFCTAFGDGVDAHPAATEVLRVDKPIQSDNLRDALVAVMDAAG